MSKITFRGREYQNPDNSQSIIIRKIISENLTLISEEMDKLLRGEGLSEHRDFITFMTNGKIPHWYESLEIGERPALQNVKAIGTMIEYLFACVIKKEIVERNFPKDRIMVLPNPSRGIDLPELNIDIKAPGKKLERGPGTSTRAYSPFERLFGLDYHCIILHTNLKTEDEGPLRILRAVFLQPHELADTDLSTICSNLRERLLPEHEKMFNDLCVFLTFCRRDHKFCNSQLKKLRSLSDAAFIEKESFIQAISKIISQCNEWIVEEDGRNFSLRQPSPKEFRKLMTDPIGGKVTISFKNELFLQFRQLLEKTPANKRPSDYS